MEPCKKKQKHLYLYLSVIFLLFICIGNEASAQGNLLLTPRRVVFDGTKRSFDLSLANVGKDTATYAISIVQIRMTEDGRFEIITEPDPGQQFATKYLRFFPRSVTLAPNEAQMVKIQLVKQNELLPGEYRSHFYFRAIPNAKPLGEGEVKRDTTTISVKLTPVFGITIPAIIRVGESTAKVTMSDISLEMVRDTVPMLKLAFNRSGNMSIYGDLAVDYISANGKKTRVGIANGIAIYTPNTRRTFQFDLKVLPEVDYHSGRLVLVFSAPSDVKPEKYAEAELPLR